jgi:transposase
MEEAYGKRQWDYHKSRKIRQLEASGYIILSKVLEETDTEDEAYKAEIKWYNAFIEKGIPLTNMVACSPSAVGSKEGHPSYDVQTRSQSTEIKRLYEEELWSIQRICRKYKKSNGLIKKILAQEGVAFRQKTIRSPLWLKKTEIIDLYKSGISLNEISKEYYGSSSGVSMFAKMLREEGIDVQKRPRYSSAWDYANEIINMYKSGCLIKTITEKYNCDVSVINAIFQLNNVKKTDNTRSPAWLYKDEIIELKKENISCKELALRYNVCEGVIRKILKHDKY